MSTQYEAIIEAFRSLGGERNILKIKVWVSGIYGEKWTDFGSTIADMVPLCEGVTNRHQFRRGTESCEGYQEGDIRLIIQ